MGRCGGMKKLAVKTDRGWEWVFCHINGRILTTLDKQKALPGLDYDWFQAKFSDREFQIMKSLSDLIKGD